MIWRSTNLRYGTGKEKVNEVNFISQGVELTLKGSGGETFWEEGDDFGVDVLSFHTCLIDILGFLENLKWWFEQDIDDEGEEDQEGDGGSELEDVGTDIAKISRKRLKSDKHRHGNEKENTRAGRMLSKLHLTNRSYWWKPTRRMPRGCKETHQGLHFCTKRRTKEAQEGHITDCHVGNPCAFQSNPTVQVEHPMIEKNEGTGSKGVYT
ncbi:hypothetical protein Tco_1295949 [Tanacetum coccineum]